MTLIQNISQLATSPERKIVVNCIEKALESVQPKEVVKTIIRQSDQLTIKDKTFDLQNYQRIFVIGFGKGSAGICKHLETVLGDSLTKGFDIDVVEEEFTKIHYTKGTHPLPSQQNITFTTQVLEEIHHLSEKDLVLVVICGGGSALFESLATIDLPTMDILTGALERSSATIQEMNVIRKHLSLVKGGGLAKHLYPATVVGLIFSDVPGNDLTTIASGPTVKDTSMLEDVERIMLKYNINETVSLSKDAFIETPTEDMYFASVTNIIMLSNTTALSAMQEYAKTQHIPVRIYTDTLQGDAKKLGKELIDATKSGEILIAGGESTMTVTGTGKGGRNQALVLATLPFITENTVVASFDSDGWDNTTFAGAIADMYTIQKAKDLSLQPQTFLDNSDSTTFFEKIGDGILTGKLASNVSDLMIVYRFQSS